MAENINDRKVFSLLEVTRSIQKTITERYKDAYWIKAEMNKLNFYPHSGHCYPELVEKQDGKIIAQIRSNLWKDDYLVINNNFLDILKEPLKDGIKILFKARISFDPNYGISLRIIDIDAAYTLGDLEKEKQDTINRLISEGVFHQNKQLKMPLLPQRIAIISVDTSKGYADFLKVLQTNHWNYKFFHLLFPSLLQGEKAVPSMINQLQQIKKIKHHFDVVAIIRGGGGDIGLSCYNNYELASEIARFPIPVITGIGHATNETVAEIISFSNAITPTKLAEYLIQHFHNFSVPVQKAEEKIVDKSRRLISDERSKFLMEVKLFRSLTETIVIDHRNLVKEQARSLFQHAVFRFRNEKSNLDLARESIRKGSFIFCGVASQQMRQLAITLKKDTGVHLTAQTLSVLSLKNKFTDTIPQYLKKRNTDLHTTEKSIQNMSPANVLKRGYSITLVNGKAQTSSREIKKGDLLKTILFEGTVDSTVQSSEKTNES